MMDRGSVGIWAVAVALSVLAVGARAQQQPAPTAPLGDIYESSGEPIYSDVYETDCKKNNDQNNPYADMNPLVCYGFAFGADSNGQCSFHGLKVIKQVGTACYYCQPLDPPVKGFIIPMDDLKAAEGQGFICGADQADPQCEAVCQGNGTFNPPPGTKIEGGTPTPKPATPPPPAEKLQPQPETPQSETPMPPPPPCNCTQTAGSNTPGECIGQGAPQQPQESCQQIVTVSAQGDEAQFVKGFATGLGQCVWAACTNPITIAAIGVSLYKSKYQPIINLLGGAAGAVVGAATLKNMLQGGEQGQPASADPYDVGVFVGKDFCKFEAAFFGVSGLGLRGTTPPNTSASSQVGQCSMQMPQGLSGILSGTAPGARVCAVGSAEPPCNVSMPTGLQGVIESAIPASATSCPATLAANFRILMQDTSWLKGMNSPGCGGNCGLCTAAVAQALLGKGILRVPNICPTSTSTAVLENAFNSTFHEFDSVADMNNAIYNAGDVSQGIVWVGKADGTCGHFFYIVNDQNDVKLLDGQLGKEITWNVVQSWMQKSGWTRMSMMRTH